MSLSSQFYTGADPLPVPEPHAGRKRGRGIFGRGLAGPAVVTVIVSMAATAGVMRLFWQPSSESSLPLEFHTQAPGSPAVHADKTTKTAREWPAWPVSGRSGGEAPRTPKPVKAEKAEPQPDPNQQIQKVIVGVPALPPPFPTEEEVKVGTPRAHLIQAYGKPDLRARTLQKQRLIETYVYEQPERATVVHMQDGKVVGTSTGQPERVRAVPSESEQEP
ncbi:MAG TPA: hypothetical protein VJN43_04820 [Bryobacteraceae bacterium]|nr:hypothetical protein [Bryobacteraceae bacterium]